MKEQIEYNATIGSEVYSAIRAGVSVRDIFFGTQDKWGVQAPKSMTTFYKLYRGDMDRARAETVEAIGNRVVDQALSGDVKSQELYLRSKGGWSPNETVNQGEAESELEEAENAMEALKRLLGKE